MMEPLFCVSNGIWYIWSSATGVWVECPERPFVMVSPGGLYMLQYVTRPEAEVGGRR